MDIGWWHEWLLEDPAVRLPFTLTTLGLALVLPLVGLAVYLWRLADRIVVERIFPPAGYRRIGNRPTISGDDAITCARGSRVLAVFLVLMALLLASQLWRFAVLMGPAISKSSRLD